MRPIAFFLLALALAGDLSFPHRALGDSNSADMEQVVEGNSEFALDLYARLRTGEGNVFFSPYSISTALSMTYAGARAETANQMARTLHFVLPTGQLHPAFFELKTNLDEIQKKGQVRLAVANSLWPQIGFKFRTDYLTLCEQYYASAIVPVDFVHHTEAARTKINDWVSDRTNEKIPELIKPGMLDEENRLVLVDAIYFKGDWETKFNANRTQDQPFHISSGKSITARLMEQTEDFGYAEFPDLQVLEMPYAGGQISMVVLLPRDVDGLTNLEAHLTPANLKSWMSPLGRQKVHVFFPRFTFRSQFLLADTLSDMGMPDAFDPFKADFSGMDGRKDLYISSVIHEAYVKVDEEGTEAAAATAVMMTELILARPPPIPTFRADHPFLFLIRDNQTGSILFLGRVMDPTR
ncbi:MAG TPA: serpin family protein [Candidatus Sulfotelmatobacter sp.]|nr:serpin family protein [Candidatus Sulfotelmatobacter sp.]